MKTRNYLYLTILMYLISMAYSLAQTPAKQTPFFIPQSATFSANANFHWYLNDGIDANICDQIHLRAELKYRNNLSLVILNKTNFKGNYRNNKFSDIYFAFFKSFRSNKKIPVFKYGTSLNLKVGVIEWYPSFTNVQLILENAEKFINPPQIYGGSLVSVTPLTNNKALTFHFGGHTGNLINHTLDAELLDFYLNYTKVIKYDLGVAVQAGRAQGSQHIVNFANITYQPKLENLKFDIKAGKLPSVDQSPYGVHLGIVRTFKYIALGGYYEKRIDQHTRSEIAGIYWNIIGPPKLAKLISTFNLFYDFNTNRIWMWVPLIKLNIKYK